MEFIDGVKCSDLKKIRGIISDYFNKKHPYFSVLLMISNRMLMYYYYRVMPRIEGLDSLFSDDRVIFVTDAHPFSPLWDPGVDLKLEGEDEILLDHEVSAFFTPRSN